MDSASTPAERDPYDVMVIGGGPAGLAAAIAAARQGASVALVERHDVLGGMGTVALVNNFCPAHLDGKRLIIGGILKELRERLIARRAIFASHDLGYRMEPYDPAVFAEEAAAMVRDSGAETYFGCTIQSADFSEGEPVVIRCGDGRCIRAHILVDATGDAVIAARAGVPFSFGRAGDSAVMPLTYCYKIGPIDLKAVADAMPDAVWTDSLTQQPVLCISGAHKQVAQAQANGELSIPRDHIASIMNIPGQPDAATVNFGRVFVKDPTDGAQIADAEQEGRKQLEEGVRFFRKYLPGFSEVQVLERARQIGVRESRQIRGLYTLTVDDVLQYRQFDDVIAQCCYSVDVHDPDSHATRMIELERGRHYDIPLRCLIPASGPGNLLVAGRSISATQEAMSSFRVSPSAMAIGEAAGVTAAVARERRVPVREASASEVQRRLLAAGAILE